MAHGQQHDSYHRFLVHFNLVLVVKVAVSSCQREVRTSQCCCPLVSVQNDPQQARRRAMKPTFLAVFPLSLFCFLFLFLFRFCCCFVRSLFRFLYVCSLSLLARPLVAGVAGHSLVQWNPQEGDRTDTWLGGLFVPSTKNKICTLYLFQIRHGLSCRIPCHALSKGDRSINNNPLFY